MRKAMRNKRVDRAVFRRTAMKTKTINIAGKVTPRGGTRL